MKDVDVKEKILSEFLERTAANRKKRLDEDYVLCLEHLVKAYRLNADVCCHCGRNHIWVKGALYGEDCLNRTAASEPLEFGEGEKAK